MKKTILLFASLMLAFTGFSKEIIITKKGGKKCSIGSSEICYDYVKVRDNEDRYTQTCKDKGPNKCPKVGIVSVGTIAFDMDNFIVNVENAIINGSTSASGVITDSNGVIVANYTWTGLINVEGNLEYDIIINDEI